MSNWRDCILDPPDEGKKVLCCNEGDFFVAQRFKEYFCPMPFVMSKFSKTLCKPKLWKEIDFPPPYTGYLLVSIDDGVTLLKISELKEKDLQLYNELCDMQIEAIGIGEQNEKVETPRSSKSKKQNRKK